MQKFKGCHIWYLVLSLLLFVGSILLFPNFLGIEFGDKLTDALLGFGLLMYFIFVIIPELDAFSKKYIELKIITLIETIFVAFLMVYSMLAFMNLLDNISKNLVAGIVLFLRGVSLLVSSYYKERLKLKKLTKYLYILLISFGVWTITYKTINDDVFLYVICVGFLLFSFISFITSLVYWPRKKRKKDEIKNTEILESQVIDIVQENI